MAGDERDPDTWERSTNIAHALIEDSEQTVYLGVTEFYVGLHESSGGKGLRTTRYEFYVNYEPDDEDKAQSIQIPIEPWNMISIGQMFLNAGISQLQKQLAAIANKVDQQIAKEKI